MKLNKKTDKKRYHITITDLYTGATITDTDSGAIIGAIDKGDKVQGVGAVYCNNSTLMEVINTANEVITNCKKEVIKYFISNMLNEEN